MGAPIFIDSMVLTLGRFLRNQGQERNIPNGGMAMKERDAVAASSTLITLSSGQMLLPEIGAPYQFLK